jgi:hypothetical protein
MGRNAILAGAADEDDIEKVAEDGGSEVVDSDAEMMMAVELPLGS